MRKILFFCTLFSLMLFFDFYNIEAENIILNDNSYAIEINNNINVYENNVLTYAKNDVTLLDMKDEYLLYNHDNVLYLYNLTTNTEIVISTKAYNAYISDKFIIYESDQNNSYLCKNIVESIQYRNCYKLYLYDINTGASEMLNLSGNDNYLNDVEDGYITFTSIHNNDEVCMALCSYVNIYNINQNENIILNEYNDFYLDMSGNSFIDQGVVVFESVPNIYGCDKIQLFKYDIKEKIIDIITKDSNTCFNYNSEINSFSNGYLIFNSKYKNYEDNRGVNYIYSIVDEKYKVINDSCKYNPLVINDGNSIYCIEDDDILIYKIDEDSPKINVNKQYVALREEKNKLINNLEYYDDLSNKDGIRVNLLSDLSNIGTQTIDIELCDRYDNCSINTVVVEILDIDTSPPKIYCNELITIRNNQIIDINNYGFALDNVDGKLSLEIVNRIDYTKKGEYVLLIKSIDSSGNVGYKEIELIIYDTISIYSIYYLLVMVCVILVVIIYILRVKNRRHF